MATIKSRKLKSIPAEITVPGDKSISHRSAMFAGLANGRTIALHFRSPPGPRRRPAALLATTRKLYVVPGCSPVTVADFGHLTRAAEALASEDVEPAGKEKLPFGFG